MLILDEPTNHLDIESREALEDALRAFTGAILLVSHDRALLDAVGTRTVAVEDGTLHSYLGGWAEYVRVREERLAARRRAPTARRRTRPRPARAATGAARRGAANGVAAPAPPARGRRRRAAGATAQAEAGKPKGPSKNRLSAQQKAERAVEDGRGRAAGAGGRAGRPGGVGDAV